MKRQTTELKRKLVETGVAEIEKAGIDQLSLRNVAKACGVTHGTPYRHFESKEGYLQEVLREISSRLHQKLIVGLTENMTAREKLSKMGLEFVLFAQEAPYFFEALFLKYPFHYMNIHQERVDLDCQLPGFQGFRAVVLDLIQEEGLNCSETDTVMHLWSYITGLAMLTSNSNGVAFDSSAIAPNIELMLTYYIKGGKP